MQSASQIDIKDKLRKYMELVHSNAAFIKRFEDGYCTGISALWLYAHRLQLQANPFSQARDDYNWLQETIQTIVNWDGVQLPDKKKQLEFDRFISYIEFLQDPNQYLAITQTDLDKTIEDVHTVTEDAKEKRHLTKEYSIAGLLTLKQLKQLLRENIIHERRLIQIYSHDHATALFKVGDYYYYFDPNNPQGEVKLAATERTLDKIAELIFEANGLDSSKPSPLAFNIFSLNEAKKPTYPGQKEILARLHPALFNKDKEYAQGRTSLQQAASIGSLESVEYFLAQRVEPADLAKALNLAAIGGYDKIVHILLAHNADPNYVDENRQTAFLLATHFGHLRVVQELLSFESQEQIKLAFVVAARNGHLSILHELFSNYKFRPEDIVITLLIAAKDGQLETIRWLLAQHVVQLNIELAEDILERAVAGGHENIVRWLFEDTKFDFAKQVEVNLCMAARMGHLSIVQCFLDRAKKIEADVLEEALLAAIKSEHFEIVQKLLTFGANPHAVDIFTEQSAMLLAVRTGNVKITTALFIATRDKLTLVEAEKLLKNCHPNVKPLVFYMRNLFLVDPRVRELVVAQQISLGQKQFTLSSKPILNADRSQFTFLGWWFRKIFLAPDGDMDKYFINNLNSVLAKRKAKDIVYYTKALGLTLKQQDLEALLNQPQTGILSGAQQSNVVVTSGSAKPSSIAVTPNVSVSPESGHNPVKSRKISWARPVQRREVELKQSRQE